MNLKIAAASLVATTLACVPAFAQAPTWLRHSTNANTQVTGIAADSSENIYVVGNFLGEMDADPGTATVLLQAPDGESSGFVSKFTSAGRLLWAQQSEDSLSGVTVSPEGKVLLYGGMPVCADPAFAPGEAGCLLSNDAMLVHIDPNGNEVWRVNRGGIGSTGFEEITAVDFGPEGQIYCVGNFFGAMAEVLGAPPNVISSGDSDILLMVVDSAGVLLDLQGWGSDGRDIANGVALAQNNLVIGGTYGGPLTLSEDFATLALDGATDGFVASYSLYAESFTWANRIGTAGIDQVSGVQGDGSSRVYVSATTGWRDGPGSVTYAPEYYYGKFNRLGQLDWEYGLSAEGGDMTRVEAADETGVFISGRFRESLNLSPIAPITLAVTPPSPQPVEYDSFVLKLGPAGDFRWVKQQRTTLTQSITDLTQGSDGTVYFAGAFAGNATFDLGIAQETVNLPDAQHWFLAKMLPAPTVTGVEALDASPTNAATVRFRVTFSEPVFNVEDADNFIVDVNGTLADAEVSEFSGGDAAYVVTVNTGTGDGELRLRVSDFDTIRNADGIALGGAGFFNGDSELSEAYVVDKSVPEVRLLTVSQAQAFAGQVVQLRFELSENPSAVPTVRINGNLVALTAGTTYMYAYTVGAGDPLGAATVTLQAADAAGNVLNFERADLLTIVAPPVQEEGEDEGASEGESEGATEGEPDGGCDDSPFHDADTNTNNVLDLSEVLRIIQLHNAGGYARCDEPATEDGFCPQ